MQISLAALLSLGLATFVTATPLISRDIVACETQTAATQVACIDGCNGDAACITSCTATAVAGYIACANA